MNNAALEGVVTTNNGTEITLNYKTGTVKALILPQTSMSQTGAGGKEDLKVGETVFAVARKEADNQLTLVRLQVSKDGIKPGQ